MIVNPVKFSEANSDGPVDFDVHSATEQRSETVFGLGDRHTPRRCRRAYMGPSQQHVDEWVYPTLAETNHRTAGIRVNMNVNPIDRCVVAAKIPRHTKILVEIAGHGSVPAVKANGVAYAVVAVVTTETQVLI